MGIVRFALRFPYTFYGLAALIIFLGISAICVMPIDIFPEINIPVVNVIWQYTGLSTPEMEQRVSTYSQYAISTSVSGIKNMEAQTLNGISVQKIFFQPDVNIDLAIAQIVSATNYIRVLLPAGIQAPIVVSYNASSIPVLQLSLASDNLNEQKLYDYGYYNLRQQLAPVPGVTFPTPDGGKYRQIMVDIDPTKLQAKGLTPTDVVNAVNAENLTLPSGLAKIGDKQYTVLTNAMPTTIEALNNIPVKFVNGATVFVRDVGQVRDASAVQQNIVRQNGERSVLLSVIKNGNASTLAVVKGVRKVLEIARAAAPPGLAINELFDQAKLVSDSVASVVREGAIAAGLTALMILLFLGSWRSTLIVMISIPLSILTSIVVLHFLGETINTMTLGGLALAVGILVDNSTVTIENTHRLRTEEGHEPRRSDAARIRRHCRADPGLDARHQLRVHVGGLPRGPGQVPVHAARARRRVRNAGVLWPLADVDADHDRPAAQGRASWWNGRASRGWFARLHRRVRTRLRAAARRLRRRAHAVAHAAGHCPDRRRPDHRVGRRHADADRPRFLSAIDGGQIKLHVRAPAGTRIEVTEAVFQAVEDKIREVIPEGERDLIVDDIGIPQRVYNLAFTDGSTIGPNDGVVLVALKPGHAPTARYVRKLREVLPAEFPEVTFYFQAADMVTQILNFGLPAQIDVRTVGRDRATNLRVTQELRRRIAEIPGIVDAHLQQEIDGPAFMAAIDRARALQFGLNAQSIANDVNISLSSSAQVTPNFWTDPASGIPYYITVQTPQRQVSSLGELGNTPIATKTSSTGSPIPGLLSNVARFDRNSVPTNLNQTNIQPAYDVYASVQGRDLGRVSDDISKIVAELQKELKPGNSIEVRGQIQSMHDSFRNLRLRIVVRRGTGLSAHAGELPESGRSLRRDPGASGDAVRDCDYAVHHRYEPERALADGSHHGSRRRLGEFHSARHLRARAAARRQYGVPGRDRCGPYPDTAGADDGGGDDRRHDPHGDRRRRRGAECGTGARGDRRPAVRDTDDPAYRPISVCHAAQAQ